MRGAVAIIMAVLGTILVLSGAAALWATALTRQGTGGPEPAHPITKLGRGLSAVSQLPAPDRLIVWGVVLLGLSAIASGAISLAISATAGTH